MAIGEKGQSTLWLNPRMLPSLGSVGIPNWILVSSPVMGFPPEYIYLVQFSPEYIYLVQSTLHSVFMGLVVRVCYVRTHPLGFQHVHFSCLCTQE